MLMVTKKITCSLTKNKIQKEIYNKYDVKQENVEIKTVCNEKYK